MIYLIIALCAAALAIPLIIMEAKTRPIARKVFTDNLVRTSPDKWGRVCSAPQNEEQVKMWESGLEWGASNAGIMREVTVESEGLRLAGELYDRGSKRTVIILPGRCECLKYSYYYARSYDNADCNILVVDARSHGKSEGGASTIGVHESVDLLEWVRFLHDECGTEEVILHTICIGSAAAILAISSGKCPAYVSSVIADGAFCNFRETFKNHMKADGHPAFPVLGQVMRLVKKELGVDVMRDSPEAHIAALDRRVLFIFGEKDIFSVPEKSRMLFERCGSADKSLVWMPEGGHSHLRINNTERYDAAVLAFMAK